MTPRLHILRHGETAWCITGQHTGRTDIPLTAKGEDEARALGERLRSITFARVFTSPLRRARQTCDLAAPTPQAEIEPDLAEWDYGDYEGKLADDIHRERPEWTIFKDGAPHGETPDQIGSRADRLIARLRTMTGDIALFTHGHFGRVLAARWIGLSVAQSRPLLLSTASHSILCFDHDQPEEPAIELWNDVAAEPPDMTPETDTETTRATLKEKSVERWENEGGEIPFVHPPMPAPLIRQGAVADIGKKLFIFDLDGTLAESKSSIDAEMATGLQALLARVKVAIISGGDWPQFEQQVLAHLPTDSQLKNLVLLPTCGTKFYQYETVWTLRYAESFTSGEKARITEALKQVSAPGDGNVGKTWGEQIDDRDTQITFSALGQQAPLEEKAKWDPDFSKRKKMKTALEALIPGFSVRLGGTTSIDVTRPGIDKAYGIQKLREILGIELAGMIFAGDAVFPGGNDYPVKTAGVASIRVKNPEETKRVIETFLACLPADQPPVNQHLATPVSDAGYHL